MTEDEKKVVAAIIRKASTDLDELYCKIKKSNKILKYRKDGHLINEIYANIIANFSLLQIMEFSGKAKMVTDKNVVLSRKERFEVCADIYKGKFEYLYSQHIELLDSQK